MFYFGKFPQQTGILVVGSRLKRGYKIDVWTLVSQLNVVQRLTTYSRSVWTV